MNLQFTRKKLKYITIIVKRDILSTWLGANKFLDIK